MVRITAHSGVVMSLAGLLYRRTGERGVEEDPEKDEEATSSVLL